MKSMQLFSPYQFKKVRLTEKIFERNEELKLGYLNVRNLMKGKSLEFLNNDRNVFQKKTFTLTSTKKL